MYCMDNEIDTKYIYGVPCPLDCKLCKEHDDGC